MQVFGNDFRAWVMKMYHVIIINEKTGKKVYMTLKPESHEKACILKSKINPNHKFRSIQLEEVIQNEND